MRSQILCVLSLFGFTAAADQLWCASPTSVSLTKEYYSQAIETACSKVKGTDIKKGNGLGVVTIMGSDPSDSDVYAIQMEILFNNNQGTGDWTMADMCGTRLKELMNNCPDGEQNHYGGLYIVEQQNFWFEVHLNSTGS